MNFPSSPLLTRALAVIGAIAIVVVVVMQFTDGIVPVATQSYGGDIAYLRADSTAYETAYDKSLVLGAPELLADASADIDQKVIKTGNLTLTVDDAVASAQRIRGLANEKNGTVQTSSIIEQEDGTHYGYVTLRVPAEAFEATMAALKEMAVVVESENVSSSDVTEQYIDLSARLNNAKAQEVRYVEILKVANIVEEMLQIEQALANVRATIESYTGQIQYLDSQVGMSTITVTLSEEPSVTIGGKVFRPGTTVKQAAQAVVAIAQAIVVAVIWVVIVGVGVGVPLALIGWLVWKGMSRLRKR